MMDWKADLELNLEAWLEGPRQLVKSSAVYGVGKEWNQAHTEPQI
jgi:hypothetical protein